MLQVGEIRSIKISSQDFVPRGFPYQKTVLVNKCLFTNNLPYS
jgi:hypothetical protein